MTILILGQTGQVGFELKRVFAPLGTILAPTRQTLDLLNEDAVDDYLEEHSPSLILNAAAYTAVDKAESEPNIAAQLNSFLPRQLAGYAVQHNATLIHYSSDYVYSGRDTQPYDEESATGPLSVYGQTKLDGDQAIIATGCRHWIFRTSWVYSARAHNFMKTILRLAKEKTELNVVADQIGSPTPARLIAQISLLAHAKEIPTGVYHLAPRGEVSWQGFALAIVSEYLRRGQTLALTPQVVKPIATKDYPTPAERPANSHLCLAKLEQALGTELPSWTSQLEQTLEEYLSYQP